MLSSQNWDYTTKGLAAICKDGIDSINSCIRELEKHGYIIRERMKTKGTAHHD
ncbi:MAG: helix-turn-helix domain-containing protein [Eubacterium sp.]